MHADLRALLSLKYRRTLCDQLLRATEASYFEASHVPARSILLQIRCEDGQQGAQHDTMIILIARLEDELVSEYEGYNRYAIYGDLVIVRIKAAEYGIVGGGCSAFKAACSLNQAIFTGKTFRILAMKHYSILSEVDNVNTFWDFSRQLVACESCILYAY